MKTTGEILFETTLELAKANALNAELLAALKEARHYVCMSASLDAIADFDRIIAKTEEQQ